MNPVSDEIPAHYSRIKIVRSFDELVNAEFGGEDKINGVLWRRSLTENFQAAAEACERTGYTDADNFKFLYINAGNFGPNSLKLAVKEPMSDDVRLAMERITEDAKMISRYFGQTVLRVVRPWDYTKNTYNFHADGEGVDSQKGRLLCSYTAPATEILRNFDAERKFGTSYFTQKASAQPFRVQPGNMLRIAADTASTDALVHRAPATNALRLILVGG